MSYYIYILYSSSCDKYYVGHTDSLGDRLGQHNAGQGDSFTRLCLPWSMVYHEVFPDRSSAMKREREIKSKKSRKYIEWLISAQR
ncbi:MAG TPA: GIY-YIG nuclease family protein [Cyclobacteriaceae bacterium]|nr:GIY-YIG nuclease family protein [Cyclobacteriaceae bacterium]